jgi:hypothetical protein
MLAMNTLLYTNEEVLNQFLSELIQDDALVSNIDVEEVELKVLATDSIRGEVLALF